MVRIPQAVAVYTLARAVRMTTSVVVLFIVVGILIHALGADTSSAIVSLVDDVAKWLVQPFRGLIDAEGDELRIAVNWGLAAVVYAIIGRLLARLIARSAVAGRTRRPWRRRTAL
jgi:hypothetical protein